MENASLVHHIPEATEKNKTNHTTRRALTKLKFPLATFYVLTSVALLMLMLTVVPVDLEDISIGINTICADSRNTNAYLAWMSEKQVNAGNVAFAYRSARMLKTLFQMNPLSITMGWGSFTFPAVKTIDTAWNLIVSRIGQMILGMITAKVITAWLAKKMESQPVPYQLVRETALSSGYSVVILWYLFDMKRCSKLWKHHRLQLLGFAVCIFLVMVYPVLADAMTGYTVRRKGYFKGINGDVLNFQMERDDYRVRLMAFKIDNGHILNLSDPTYFWSNGGNLSGFMESAVSPKFTAFYDEGFLFYEFSRLYSNCTDFCNIFHWPNNETTTLPDGQTLKIRDLSSFDWATDPIAVIDNVPMTLAYIAQNHLTCLARESYMWGFSWHLLLLWSVLNVIQASILWVTWYRLRHHTGMRQPYGPHRAMIDLADMSLDIIGEGVQFMTEKDIKHALDRANAGLMTG